MKTKFDSLNADVSFLKDGVISDFLDAVEIKIGESECYNLYDVNLEAIDLVETGKTFFP